jgi:hypothetical protein
MGQTKNACRIIGEKPFGKSLLGRLRRRWENNIKMDLREIDYEDGRQM